ncbi:MAG: M3 family oligoendopeptidase [Phycisphaerae bacterium]|nr:M3 family oligoendopeptidase [Phycisphaerae bacterium]
MSNPEFPRQYLKPDDTLTDWNEINPYFDELEARRLDSVQDVNQWLLDYSELQSAIDEVGSDCYVKMTCQTDDAEREKAYLHFVEQIMPRCEPRRHALNVKYVSCPHAAELPQARFRVFNRSVRNQVELFREENIPLEVEEAKLTQEFQKISGLMTVQFDECEQTLQQLNRYLEWSDREIRRQAWEKGSARRLGEADAFDDIFGKLFALRHRIALNTGAKDYREYAFKVKERFDYTPEDCWAFHDAVEQAAVPVLRAMHARRREALGVDSLRPWDLAVDEKGRGPLKPFEDTTELIGKCSRIFHRIHTELGEQFDEMCSRGYLDLESRKGKAPGGYQTTYEESRHPFIFMNAVGLHRDVQTLIHEGGHAFHAYAARHDPLIAYRSAPLEFAEVASMGMELLAHDHLEVIYEGEDLERARRRQLEGVISVLPWIATVDAFQHWLYTNPEHTPEARRDYWVSLRERFGGSEDYSGYERELACLWQRQIHIFQMPFYYIEYGIAQLGALQLWCNRQKDRHATILAYRNALKLGGSRPLPELFAAAGIKFDFTYDTLKPLMDTVEAELQSL